MIDCGEPRGAFAVGVQPLDQPCLVGPELVEFLRCARALHEGVERVDVPRDGVGVGATAVRSDERFCGVDEVGVWHGPVSPMLVVNDAQTIARRRCISSFTCRSSPPA